MAKLHTNPLSGMRDFLAGEVVKRNYVIDVVEETYRSFGFEPLETPTMERLETLLGKYGEEGDQLIFRVLKRGEKLARTLHDAPQENDLADAGLRYDLTVPLARVAAEYQAELPRIYKRYQIQPVYRADRPAKGRFREFYQCDLDVVGSKSLVAEAELLEAAAVVLRRLGFAEKEFHLRLNHREILRGLMKAAQIPPSQEEEALIAIDKKDKIGLDGVREELRGRGIDETGADLLMQLLANCPENNEEKIAWLRNHVEGEEAQQAVEDLVKIRALVQDGAAEGVLVIDPYLARGLSYYTGPIFEVNIAGYRGSSGGGGRYDNLVGIFSGRELPACGFSFGLERILLILEKRGLFPAHVQASPDCLVTLFDDTMLGASFELARNLRRSGFRVDVYPDSGRYGKQFKYADQRGIRFALLLGPREEEAGTVQLKDLHSGDQVEIELKQIAGRLRKGLQAAAESKEEG